MANKQPIRIQYVIATLDRAGAEGQLTALLTRLDRSRFEPRLLCLTRGGPYEAELREAGVPYEILGKCCKLDPCLIPRLAQRFRRFRPHILHTWMFTSNAFGRTAALFSHVPVRIISERAVDSWKTWPYRLTDRLLARWTDCVVANAEAVRKFVHQESRIPLDRISVIPNGVDVQRFSPKAHPPSQEITFCSIGRLAQQKRMDLIIRAMGRLREHAVACRARITGEGPLAGELADLIRELNLNDRVELCGHADDVRPLLAGSDAFVLASDWEGMPNVVLEAMATGLPVVATAVDGTNELVRNEETGFLVPSGDVDALAAAMRRLAESLELRRQFGGAARRRVESEFSMEKMVGRYQEMYEDLVSGQW